LTHDFDNSAETNQPKRDHSFFSPISSTNPKNLVFFHFCYWVCDVMGNTELKKKKGFGAKWVWIVVPLIAAIVAIAVSSKTSSRISLFGVIGKACQCTQVF
jgi:hypothetical protein